jgi:hypothetical protein
VSLLDRFTTFKPEGRVIHIPGLFYRYDNSKSDCGHIRLFSKPIGGWMIHSWNQMLPDWSKSRTWWFGLFSIIHVDAGPNNELKHTTEPGWHVRFAKLQLKRIYGGFSLTFRSADRGYTA